MDKSNGIEKTKQLSTDLKDAGHIQNIVLIWLDSTANDSTIDCDNTIKQFKRIVNTIKTFTNDEQCIQFMQSMTDSRICLITSDAFGQRILPYIHGMTQLDTILIFSHNKQLYEEWTKKYPKFKGVFTEISSICEALQIAVHQCEQNILPISLFNVNIANESDEIFNRLDLSFVFIQVIKEILSKIDFGEIHLDEYVNYCRDLYPEDDDELENISQLSRDYYSKRPIWWYTQESFMCRMLHRAIRSLDAGIIVRMGFFIDDLHRDIQRFYSEQFDNPDSDTKTLTVYRGQGLLVENFDRLSKLKNGFISFNDFLLTNKNRQIAYDFAQQTATNPDLVGILFIMNIDTTDSMTPFADITKVGFFKTQDEVLFSMQSIFRIDDIELIDTNNHIYEVTLTLMKNDEENLRKLTNRIREETFFDKVGWARFGQLLIKMNQFQKAQEVYEVSLNQTTYDSEKAPLYYQLGWLKHQQKDYQAALTFYEQSLYIAHETLPSNHISLASSHTSIGAVHYSMGNYPKALAS
ncbi:hypothetical protein I4U23_003574 [Adineta vaga]|nr:hypothetical protein I4U23_003574 [Adineta vaga]